MKYFEIIKSSYGDEKQMWDAVAKVDGFLEKIAEQHHDLVRKFKEEQYEAMNGKHINEWTAKHLVAEMWHTNADGKVVNGEIATADEATTYLLAGMPQDKRDEWIWDAYVAANSSLHDYGANARTKAEILKDAKLFWFHDEDMTADNKVYWYFKDKIFG